MTVTAADREERNRMIVNRYAASPGLTMAALGAEVGLSASRVQQIIARHCRQNHGLFRFRDEGYDLYTGRGPVHVLYRYGHDPDARLWAEGAGDSIDAARAMLREIREDGDIPVAVVRAATGCTVEEVTL